MKFTVIHKLKESFIEVSQTKRWLKSRLDKLTYSILVNILTLIQYENF